MKALPVSPEVTEVRFVGLDDLVLPFYSYLFDDADDEKYNVKSITGLEPPDREIAIAATTSGGQFQGATTIDREVVALIGLNPDEERGETPQILRQRLYSSLITPGHDPRIDLQLLSHGEKFAHEFAYVTKFEASIFDQNPAIQLTLSTLNYTFRAYDLKKYPGNRLSEKHPNIYNTGTAEVGFQFAVKFTDDKNGWFIRQADNKNIGMKFDMTFHTGDILSVSTVGGHEFIHYQPHRKKVRNKLGILTRDSEWLQLRPGSNPLEVPEKISKWDWHGPVSFRPHYWGI
jgi:hypothetical protein